MKNKVINIMKRCKFSVNIGGGRCVMDRDGDLICTGYDYEKDNCPLWANSGKNG